MGWIVYLHITPSNKVYIGITHHKNPQDRWKYGNGYKNSTYFYKAILKYGWKNIIHKILFENISEQYAKNIEILLIRLYKKLNLCYNITDGGLGKLGIKNTVSDITKYKLHLSQIGKKLSLETKDKIGNSHKGKKRSTQTKLNISNSHIGVGTKKVKQFTKDNVFIKTFNSLTEAEKETKINNGHISKVCQNKRKTAGGFIWKYTN